MATKTTATGKSIEIETIAADWYPGAADPNGLGDFTDSGLQVYSIEFNPGAANDVLVIKNSIDGNENDATEWYVKCSAVTDQRVKYYGDKGKRMWPFIDYSECTLNTGAKVLITLA